MPTPLFPEETELQSAAFADSLFSHLSQDWSWRTESNHQPADYKSAALPLSHTSAMTIDIIANDFEIDEFFQRIGLHVAVKEIKFHCFRVAEGVDPYRFGGNLLLGAFTQTYRQIKI